MALFAEANQMYAGRYLDMTIGKHGGDARL